MNEGELIYPERQRVWGVRGASLKLQRRHPSAINRCEQQQSPLQIQEPILIHLLARLDVCAVDSFFSFEGQKTLPVGPRTPQTSMMTSLLD